MGRRKKTFHTYVDVEVDIESGEILELLEDDLSAEEYEIVEKALKRKTYSTCVDSVGVDIDIDFDDLLGIIDNCSPIQLEMIRDAIHNENQIKVDTLYDENKLRVLKSAFNKYNLDELQEKLNIKNNEY